MIQARTETWPATIAVDSPKSHFLALLKSTERIFHPGEFEQLLPEERIDETFSPLRETERIAFDFLRRGGKRFRPFVTLAAYDALAADPRADHPFPVRRAAIAVEAFHKASLVHDDIEDDDLFRYGRETLHRQHDVPIAINVGDFLVGLGYRIVTADRKILGCECAADILHQLMDAHVRLSEGQGAELAWRRATSKQLRVDDALRIYASKTSPAFEAALYAGVRLAGDADDFAEPIATFSHHLGIAFQILNDLNDWIGDENNKLVAGQDAGALRPTVLLGLALEAESARGTQHLASILERAEHADFHPQHLRAIFQDLGTFERAEELISEHRRRAERVAESLSHPGLSRLFRYLTTTVLARAPK